MTDSEIIRKIKDFGVDYTRLKRALDTHEDWGKMIYSFEYLTVLGVVETAMRNEGNATPHLDIETPQTNMGA